MPVPWLSAAHPATLVALAGLGLGLAGAMAWRRLRAAWVPALLAASAMAWVALGPTVAVAEPVPRTLHVLLTGPGSSAPPPAAAALVARLLPESRPGVDRAVARVLPAAELGRELDRRAVAAGSDPEQLVLGLDGPWLEPVPARPRTAPWVCATAPVSPLAPEQLTLDLPTVLMAGRRARFGIHVPELPANAVLEWHTPVGVVSHDLAPGPARRVEIQVQAAEPGPFAVDAILRCGAWSLERGAELLVHPAPRVLALGLDPRLVALLRAQGLKLDLMATVPESLDGVGALVAARPLTGAELRTVAPFVDQGGGLLALGSREGLLGAAGAELLPVVVQELPPADAPGPGAGNAPGGVPVAPQPAPTTETPPPVSRPTPTATELAPPGPVPTSAPILAPRKRLARKVAMAFVIDRSGSMTEPMANCGCSCFELALASARDTARALAAEDDIALIAFAGKPELFVPLTSVGQAGFEAALSRVWVGGSTRVTSALEMARNELRRSDAPLKHIVLITDGAFAEDFVPPVTNQLATDGTTVSGIAISSEQAGRSTFRVLEGIAESTRGRYLQVSDPRAIGRILVAEVERVAGPGPGAGAEPGPAGTAAKGEATAGPPPPVAAGPDRPAAPAPPSPAGRPGGASPESQPARSPLAVHRVADSPVLSGLPATGPLPAVQRLIRATARPGALVLLGAGPEGLPLLASWNLGLGRVTAWCSAFDPSWAPEWLAHGALGGLLGQWLTDVLAPAARHTEPVVLEGRSVRLPRAVPADLHAPLVGQGRDGAALSLRWEDPWRLAADAPLATVALAAPDVAPPETLRAEAPRLAPAGVPAAHLERVALALGGKVAGLEAVPPLLPVTRQVPLSVLWLAAVVALLALAATLWWERVVYSRSA